MCQLRGPSCGGAAPASGKRRVTRGIRSLNWLIPSIFGAFPRDAPASRAGACERAVFGTPEQIPVPLEISSLANLFCQYNISTLGRRNAPGKLLNVRTCKADPVGDAREVVMTVIESITWVILGSAVVAGVPGLLYFRLPRAVLDSAMRHGRYAGLGVPHPARGGPGADGWKATGPLLGQRA